MTIPSLVFFGIPALAIWIGLAVALKTGKMVNYAWRSMPIFKRADRPAYYWVCFTIAAVLSAVLAYMAIWPPP